MSKHPETQFLHQRNTDLHKSDEVEDVVNYLRDGGESIPNQPADKIHAYLGFLADKDYVNDGILTGDETSIRRQVEAHVIKAEDVPEAYFDLQRQIAREQGHGDITITQEMKRQLTEAAQADQRKSLENWVEYLGGEDGAYPDWFKYYTWESVIKLGNYDKEKREFDKRSRGTTAPYPELNREALAYVFDKLNKSRIHDEEVVTDEKLAKLLQSANFGKLYAYAVHEVTPDSEALRQNIKGSWKKYDQTDDPRMARRLSESLQGHGTGWCTAGESTAASQLHMGDFYVFYTEDDRGKETIPRVAIRMQDGEVAELRGIEPGQNLEGIMSDVAMEKLQELPGGEEYIQKAEDMKRLTAIEKRLAKNPEAELSKDEIVFLYELDHQIEGFGYQADPRIGEIRQKRGERDKAELAQILIEAIRTQLKTSYIAYSEVATQLNKDVLSTEFEFEHVFAAKDEEWRKNGVYDEVVERFMHNGMRFNLLATPDINASKSQIFALAERFGDGHGQPDDRPTIGYGMNYASYSGDYEELHYIDRQLSGFKRYADQWLESGRSKVRFGLIEAEGYSPRNQYYADSGIDNTGYGVDGGLDDIQAAKPHIKVRVPSLLDAITNWYTLSARGDELFGDTCVNKTYVEHTDIVASYSEGVVSRTAASYVGASGTPHLVREQAARTGLFMMG